MLNFDVAMPLALFLVTVASLLLNNRVEVSIKSTLEKREFRTIDIVLLAIVIGGAVSLVVFVPHMALISLFMFSYAILLFTFAYLFSDVKRNKAVLLILIGFLGSLVVGTAGLIGLFGSAPMSLGGLAAFGIAIFAFAALVVELKKPETGYRWYIAVLPPALFITLFFVFNSTPAWFPFLFDAFGFMFAILITLYLSSLFTWKTTIVFAGALTVIDFILVLVIPVMEAAATHVAGLGLPVVIVLPIVPPIISSAGLFGLQPVALGLGDFFFAGTLAAQTGKKFSKRAGIISAISMSVAFGIFEILLLNTNFGAFPGTLMIIFGWILVVAWQLLVKKRKNRI